MPSSLIPIPTETDYLVVGCGASALSFIDVMLRESDATFTIVDRRHAPGGHWNDAYPFVRLHQPSAYYGVASRVLGRGEKDTSGFNQGYYELATGTEVTQYFHTLMRDVFLPSGRVTYLPLSEHVGAGEVVHLLSGARKRVQIRKKLVDGTIFKTEIPLSHRRKFRVGDGVTCIPTNDLPRIAPAHARFTVLGAGKTAIDSVSFLLANGVAPDAISWVIARDPWLANRAAFQPGMEFFAQTIGGVAAQFENCAAAESLEDLCKRQEASRLWLRLDQDVWPTMQHGATVTETELEHLRSVRNVIRLGHVQQLDAQQIVLTRGVAPSEPGTLFIDCTASALGDSLNNLTPVFTPGVISLQMVRIYQPTFSAAMIAHIEATISDEAEQRALTRVTPMTDTVEDWVRSQLASMSNQYESSQRPNLRSWMNRCRLSALADVIAQVPPDDAEKRAALARLRELSGPAAENMRRLANA
jgi:hypothetical protein